MKAILKTAIYSSLAIMLSACGSKSDGNSSGADSTAQLQNAKPKVKLETVSTRPVEQTFDFTANVQANITNNIAPANGVRIDKILVEVGDPVKPGQIVAEMDRTTLIQAQIQMANYRVEFNRVDELYKVGGASKSEWDARKMALDVAQTAYDNLATNTSLVSPIRGIVTARNYDNGDMYSPSQPVLVVEQIAPVKIRINISESLFKYIRKGMGVDIDVDVYPGDKFGGKVSLIYPTIDEQTRTFPVEITIPNTDGRVRPGMFARVIMSLGTQDHVVAPDRAIVKQIGSGDRYIYVYKDGKVSYQKVELGRRMNDQYEVISGVNNGESVVVAGQTRLNNGMEVDIEK